MSREREPGGSPIEALLDDDALLEQLLAEAGVAVAVDGAAAPLRRRAQLGPAPLSFAQELLWLLDRATPGLTAYNVPIARRIVGLLDPVALRRSLSAVVARHEALRTRFDAVDGRPAQLVDPPSPLDMQMVDLAGVPAAERAARAAALVDARVRRTFDLARDHMFRATLVRLDEREHVLLLETHHIVWDGWSLGIVFREVGAAYRAYRNGGEPAFAPLAVQYPDYAAWQRETLAGAKLDRLIAYWREQLGDDLEPLELPADYPPAAAPSYAGTQRSLALDADETEAVARLAQRFGGTPYMIVLAAYAAVLHRYTGRTNVLIGSSVAGRMETQTEAVVGFFNNTLAMRADCSGDPSFGELVRRVRETCLGAYDHQDVPLEKLVLELRKDDPNPGGASLFNVVLTSQDALPSPLELDGLTVEPYGVDAGATKFDLTLFMAQTPHGLRLTLRARSDLWTPETIERFAGQVRRVLAAGAADPDVALSRLDLLTAAERETIARCNATAVAFDPAGVVPLVATAAVRVPERIAVRDAGGSVTYAELDRRANRLAHRLRALGAGSGSVVGLMLERSVDAIVALLGILKSGAAYVPLIPDLPDTRLRLQLAESGCRVVVGVAADAARLGDDYTGVYLDRDAAGLAAEPDVAPAFAGDPDAPAYVLFTSGSTGVPKAVVVTHGNLANYTRAVVRVLADVPAGAPGDGFDTLDGWHFGLTSTLGADLGNTALFPALCAGATLHVLASETATDPHRFAASMAEHPLDVLKLTPSHYRALLAASPEEDRAALFPARWLICGGERLGWELVDAIEATIRQSSVPRFRLLNHYGPTEATVGACTFEVTAESRDAAVAQGAQSVPIGRPLANVRAHVVDAGGADTPFGVPGELWLAGAGVAAGYLGRPELSAERFVTTVSGERVYRTGDRVRRLVSGAIEFLGRVDTQVKVRGYRVELAEIEAFLAAAPGVAGVAVVLREHAAGEGDGRVVAYVVANDDGATLAQRLTDLARERLPQHMVPSAIVTLDALPLTRNGKLDRRALPYPDAALAGPQSVAPRTPVETQLATIWAEAFKRESGTIGVTDDFFALGGHSLLAIRVLGKISRAFSVRLALRTLFESPTIEGLAKVLEAQARERPAAAGGIRPVARATSRADADRNPPAGGVSS